MRIPLTSICAGALMLMTASAVSLAHEVGPPPQPARPPPPKGHGLKAAALPLVSAVSVTDDATHRTVTDAGASASMNAPPPALTRRSGPPQPPGAGSETTGRVRMALHGPQGAARSSYG